MTRHLTPLELGCARALVRYGCGGENTPSLTRRMEWLVFLDSALAGAMCGCGACPSLDILDAEGNAAAGPSEYVLVGGSDSLLLLLHIIGGRPAYLEGAPLADEPVLSFPNSESMTFGP